MVEYSTGPTATQILLSGLDTSDRKYGSRRKRAVRTSGNIDAVEQQLVLSLEDASGTHSTVHHFEDKMTLLSVPTIPCHLYKQLYVGYCDDFVMVCARARVCVRVGECVLLARIKENA